MAREGNPGSLPRVEIWWKVKVLQAHQTDFSGKISPCEFTRLL